MPRWLLWLARLIGLAVAGYGAFALYRAWRWGHVGLHMRTLSGETPWQIEMQSSSYILFHTTLLVQPGIILVSGLIILALAWRER